MPRAQAAFFRDQARRCRRLADTDLSESTVEALLQLERQYERLAQLAENDRDVLPSH
jgi:hypothetical protein